MTPIEAIMLSLITLLVFVLVPVAIVFQYLRIDKEREILTIGLLLGQITLVLSCMAAAHICSLVNPQHLNSQLTPNVELTGRGLES